MKYLIAFALLALSGCSTTSRLPFSDKDQAWMLKWDGSNDRLFYCVANKKDKTADPQCFAAEVKSIRP